MSACNGKVVVGSKGALIGEWCGVEFGVDRVGPACPDCGRERSAPGWKVQSIPRGIQYVSRGFGTLCPLYWIVVESWFSSPLFAWSVVSVCVASVLSIWHVLVFGLLRRGLWARFHASGGRSCKGWRAQSTPRGVQCISSDASLFTIGNSSHVGSSILSLPSDQEACCRVVRNCGIGVLGFRTVSGTWAGRYKVSLVEYSTCPGTQPSRPSALDSRPHCRPTCGTVAVAWRTVLRASCCNILVHTPCACSPGSCSTALLLAVSMPPSWFAPCPRSWGLACHLLPWGVLSLHRSEGCLHELKQGGCATAIVEHFHSRVHSVH